jgi:cell division protein FtsI (penicillin-binding protein 3)
LGYWQVIKASDLRRQAYIQYGSSVATSSPRGSILSSDSFPIVANNESYLAYINPKLLTAGAPALRDLIPLLPASDSARKILTQGNFNSLSWLALSRGVSPDLKKQMEEMKIPGLGFEREFERLYPEGSSSAYITGFVGKNEFGEPVGYFGLEGYYNRQLSGKSGRLTQEKDALGRPIPIGDQQVLPALEGSDLETSIDRTVQYYAYKLLEQGINKYQASAGTVTIMDSSTGLILAMASIPGYDPYRVSDYDSMLYKNPIVSESYEPGSTFKTIVMASALDSRVVKPDTICTICSGPAIISDKTVHSWDDKYYPNSTMTEIILHSDNVGMVFVGRQLGEKRLLNYINKFGFGKLTGIDLQEESTPEIRAETDWREIELATASFGQGIAVTPLQMVTAVNAIANGGKLLPPRIVTGLRSMNVTKKTEVPKPIEVISPEAAGKMTQMMINGVNKGEVRYYKPAGYTVAGKTGTAQVPIEGYYDKNKTIASFIGFAPADQPKFTMLVTLKDTKFSPWGSTTAAPLWFDVARELFRYYQIPPQNQP